MARGFIPVRLRSGPKTCTPFPKAPHTARITATSPKTVVFSLVKTNAKPSYSPVVSSKMAAYIRPVADTISDGFRSPIKQMTNTVA